MSESGYTNGGGGAEAADPPPGLPHKGGEGSDAPASADAGADPMIVPGNNRRVQVRRKPRRKLFGKKAKEAFLESFACTANVAASAEAVGVSEGAVYSHRRNDAEFRELFWMALEQATAKLTALRLQREIERAQGLLSPGLEASLDGPPDARQIADLVKLIQALRDLTRNLSGGPRPGGRGPETASLDETCKALAKRLKAFGAREQAREGVPAEKGAGGAAA